MEIRHEHQNDIRLLHLSGRFDEIATAEAERVFSQLVDEGAQQVVLDLSGVEYISSSGLRVLLMLWRSVKQVQGELKLCGLSPFVAEVFEISNLGMVFNLYPALDDAIRAFGT